MFLFLIFILELSILPVRVIVFLEDICLLLFTFLLKLHQLLLPLNLTRMNFSFTPPVS